METWEYLVVWVDINGETWMDSNGGMGEIKRFQRTKIGAPPRFGELLNAHGAQGWEMINAAEEAITTFWFKRRVSA